MMTGAAVLCTLGAASGFVDPELPAQLAGGAALLTASSIGSRNFVFPRLKQLPESAVRPLLLF
jgi:chemotaxis receptor (MCP) glutamine deamidase CheD